MRSRLLLIGVAVIVIAALSALYAQSLSKTAVPLEQVRIATPNFALSALLFIADQEGLFAKQGLAVELIKTPFGKNALEMALRGDVNFAAVASLPLSKSILDGAEPRILATITKSEHDHMIVANGQHVITQISDLRHKTIAVPYGTTLQFYLDLALIDGGVSSSEVTTVNLAMDAALTALNKGTVDAAVQVAPLTETAIAALGFSPSVFAPVLYTLHWNIIASEQQLAARPDVAVKLLRALVAAERYVEKYPDRAIEITAGETGIDAIDLAAHWPEYVFDVQLPQSLVVTMEDEAQWTYSRRTVWAPSTPSPNFLHYLGAAPLRDVKPDAVRVTK